MRLFWPGFLRIRKRTTPYEDGPRFWDYWSLGRLGPEKCLGAEGKKDLWLVSRAFRFF